MRWGTTLLLMHGSRFSQLSSWERPPCVGTLNIVRSTADPLSRIAEPKARRYGSRRSETYQSLIAADQCLLPGKRRRRRRGKSTRESEKTHGCGSTQGAGDRWASDRSSGPSDDRSDRTCHQSAGTCSDGGSTDALTGSGAAATESHYDRGHKSQGNKTHRRLLLKIAAVPDPVPRETALPAKSGQSARKTPGHQGWGLKGQPGVLRRIS